MQGPIGFIGLGIMGRPMAKNLLKAGYPLVVHSRSQAAVQELVGAGAKTADSPAALARAAGDVLITMLPNSPDVEQVALGRRRHDRGRAAGQILADMSTISPIVSQKVGKALAAKGVEMLDAPVSGGEKGAIDGALSIMVGGEKADFEQVLPVFQAMGKTITQLGPLGAGGFTKLANQIIVAVNLTALAEALTLAAKAGLDRELTLKALGGGLAGSQVPGAEDAELRRARLQARVQDRPALQGSRAHHGVGARARRAAAGHRGGAGAVQRAAREGPGRARPLGRRSRCSRSWRASGEGMRATRRPAGARFAGPLAHDQDPAGPEGRSLQGARRHRAGLRRLLRAPAGHAAAPGVRRRPVRAPPLAHGAVGLLRRRGGRRQDRRRRGGGLLGHAGAVRSRGRADALPEPEDRPAAHPSRPGVLRREQGHAAGRGDVPLQPQAPRPLPEVRLQAARPRRDHRAALERRDAAPPPAKPARGTPEVRRFSTSRRRRRRGSSGASGR